MKLLIFFTHDRLYRSFNELNYLEDIKRFYPNVEVVLTYLKSDNDSGSNSDKVKVIKSNTFMVRFRKYVLDFHTFKYMDLSVSFKTKIRQQVKIPVNRKISFKTFILVGNLRWASIAILCSRYFYKISCLILRKLADLNKSANSLLRDYDSGVLLIVSAGPLTSIENILLYYASKYNIPSALIIDNWDNLSSKSILWQKPRLLGVWGPNMSRDAQNIHDIPIKSIMNIGNSRIFKPIPDELQDKVPYVLFAGSGNHLETEIEIVKLVAVLLEKYDLCLLYRPHPYRDMNSHIIEQLRETPNLIIDPLWIESKKSDFYSFTSLNALLNQCKYATFVIAGHSTVIVEALYLGKYVVSFSGTNSPYFENGDLWHGYHHLQELRDIPSINNCVTIDDFFKTLNSTCEKVKNDKLWLPQENSIKSIIPNFPDSYQERLISIIRILSLAKKQ